MDIWGVDGAAAEAEALAAMVSFMESVGLTSDDVGIKVNSRAVLAELLARTCGVDAAADAARFAACCVLVDKLEKVPPEALHGDFGALGVAAADVDALAAVLRDAADAGGSLAALDDLSHGFSEKVKWLLLVSANLGSVSPQCLFPQQPVLQQSTTLKTDATGNRYYIYLFDIKAFL